MVSHHIIHGWHAIHVESIRIVKMAGRIDAIIHLLSMDKPGYKIQTAQPRIKPEILSHADR